MHPCAALCYDTVIRRHALDKHIDSQTQSFRLQSMAIDRCERMQTAMRGTYHSLYKEEHLPSKRKINEPTKAAPLLPRAPTSSPTMEGECVTCTTSFQTCSYTDSLLGTTHPRVTRCKSWPALTEYLEHP